MKKKYVYFVAPILATLVFAAIYWNYLSTYDAKAEARAKLLKAQKQAEIDKENADKKKAYEEAMVAKAKHDAEKKAKEERERAQKDAREAAQQAREKAANDAERLQKQAERIAAEVRTAKEEVAKIKDGERQSLAEAAFQKDFVVKVQTSVENLHSVLDAIAKADEAAAKAAAAAAAAAKKKENS